MLRKLSFLASFTLIFAGIGSAPAQADAHNGTDGTVNCTTVDNGEATITGTFTITDNVVKSASTCMGQAIIPEGVTRIDDYAFSNDLGHLLTSVSIPGSVESIGQYAFVNNDLLTLEIPSGLKSIEIGAFYGNLLTTVKIPGSVESIGEAAFGNNNLVSVKFFGNMPAITGAGVFVFGEFENPVSNPNLQYVDVAVGATGWDSTFADRTVRDNYIVSYESVGEVTDTELYPVSTGIITTPSTPPARPGLTFTGWFKSRSDTYSRLSTAIKFPYRPSVSGDILLFAGWIDVAADLAIRTVTVGSKISGKALAQQVGVQIISPKAKVKFAISKSSKKVCEKSGLKIKMKKAGNCVVTFMVQEPKPKGGKKPKVSKTVVTFVVR